MKPELLAPAGNLKKLYLAFLYGADAVYLGGKDFSLRTFADNFTEKEMREGISFAHAHGKKVYVTANIFAKNRDEGALRAYFCFLQDCGADAVLISDPGALRLCKQAAPKLPIHISTQANTLNSQAAAFWREAGASRVVLARELSLEEIKEISRENPALELEAFVHGAMCISYSGRCYLSDYLDNRPANRGACVQACRRKYRVQSECADGWLDLSEDGKGTYLLNSKDLNMSAHLSELADAGVCSFKIEGRMKSEYYLATVVNAYRRMLDEGYSQTLARELDCAARREFTVAYAFGENSQTVAYGNDRAGSCEYIANVLGWEHGRVKAEMRTRFYEGETLEVLSPGAAFLSQIAVTDMKDAQGNPCRDAKAVQGIYTFACSVPLAAGDILRRRHKDTRD